MMHFSREETDGRVKVKQMNPLHDIAIDASRILITAEKSPWRGDAVPEAMDKAPFPCTCA